jgi:hypothetical protein
MRRVPALPPLLLLAACASAPPPPGLQVEEARLLAAAVPGDATRASLRAAFGPTTSQRFDSGVEVWLYQAPGAAGFTELVVQFDRDGVVRKVRRRPPHPFDQGAQSK